ncbi:MAG: TAXI family TRAP transporter solute-binding subunit [Alphaproteobacteria bacterium]|nr:TAXI family TRAP transporter solute-binding subunit [Alphaproteobacteria bacterium]
MTNIRIASSDLLSTFYEQAKALGQVLVAEGAGEDLEVLVTTGSVMNAEMVARGEAELGFMASNWVPRAVQGEAPFTDPVDVSIVAPLNAGPLFFVARADSEIDSVAQLRGRRVAVGHRDSGMAQHALNMARTFGWGEDGVDFAFISTFDGGDALAEGEVDAQFQAPIPSTHFNELCARTPIKVLKYAASEIEAACDAFPFYSHATVPGEFVPGQDVDLPAIGVLNVIVAATAADPGFVETLTAAYIRRARDLEGMNPLFRGLEQLLAAARVRGKAALAPGDAPLHAAAAKAFRQAELLA